jgi:molecular chaperone GrpE
MKKKNKNNGDNLDQTKAYANENDTKSDEKDSLDNSDKRDKDQEKTDDTDTKDNKEPEQEIAEESTSKTEEPPINDKDEEMDLDPVESLKEGLKEQKDKYIRLMAEFDNYKRRTSKDYERLVELANERLMIDIVEVRESFERALAITDENKNFDTFFDGIKLIFNKFNDILKKNGLSVFTEVGDEFNPEIHDALMKSPHEEIPEEHIVQIYEKGYTLKKHVIKHAKVIVSSGKPVEKNENASDENHRSTSEKQAAK